MTTTPPQRLDFTNPRLLPGAQSRLLMRWQQNVCERLVEGWGALLAKSVGLKCIAVEPVRYRAAVKELPDPGVGLVLDISEQRIPALLAFPMPLLLGVLEQMLGEVEGTWPEARKLTGLEETMLELLLQSMCEAVADGWPGAEPMPCQLIEQCRPRRCRRLPLEAELIAIRWEVTCGYGTDRATWLIPRQEVEHLLDTEDMTALAGPHQQTVLESQVLRLPIMVTVELGKTALSVAEMAALNPSGRSADARSVSAAAAAGAHR
ncbi:MAG: hypothetical protein R3B90_03385 [Planctomycetaceae bacterium]